MQEENSASQATGVVASLDRVEGERRFVIQNVGDESAFDVRFSVSAERDKNSPVRSGDLQRVFPVEKLQPGEAVTVSAIITPGTGLHFRGVATWKDSTGTLREQIFYMSA